MPQYVFTYRSAKDYVPDDSDAIAAWTAWFNEMGSSVTDMGKPVSASTALGTCDESTRLGGYSFITADDLESAVALAKGAPTLTAGGGVEVGETVELM
jgi:hypothetical protein